jgi:hypothetical protein
MSRPKRIVTDTEKEKICQDYLSGKSINQLQKETKLQKHQINKIITESGIKVLTAYETQIKNATPININCLDGDNPLSAYVLGLIFGDGHVNYDEKKYKYYVSLISVDYDIVTSAQTLFGKDFPIHIIKPINNKKQITYNIVVNSKEFAIYLREKFKLVNRKSNCLIFPKIEDNLLSYFISGLLSTDGCVRVDSRRISQSCGIEFSYSSNCLDFIKSLQYKLSEKLKINNDGHIKICKASSKRKNNNYSLRYTGSSARQILDFIYANTDELTRCKRKYDIYQKYIISLESQTQ